MLACVGMAYRPLCMCLSVHENCMLADTRQTYQKREACCRRLIPQHDAKTLLEVLDFLNQRVYCRLDASYEPTIRKLEVCMLVLGPELCWHSSETADWDSFAISPCWLGCLACCWLGI